MPLSLWLQVPRVWRDVRGNLSSDTSAGTTMPADADTLTKAQDFASQRVGVFMSPNELAAAAVARRKVELALV
jgi:hypothetical protein